MSVTKIVLTSAGALGLAAAIATAAYFKGKAHGIRVASARRLAAAAPTETVRGAEARA
jgi:hypothetical protein